MDLPVVLIQTTKEIELQKELDNWRGAALDLLHSAERELYDAHKEWVKDEPDKKLSSERYKSYLSIAKDITEFIRFTATKSTKEYDGHGRWS